LLPAWPTEWEADFKLHAPYKTVVSGHVKQGKVTQLEVQPASRRKDISFRSSDLY
jgi:alpha-L-fucosidase 2